LKNIVVGGYLVRQAFADDLSSVARVDEVAFGRDGVSPLGTEFGDAWLRHFPEGFLVAERVSRREIVAYGMSVQLSKPRIQGNWYEDTGNGTASTHDPSGDVMYGLSLASLSPGAGLAVCLAGRLMTVRRHVAEGVLYSRLTGFAHWMSENHPGEDPSIYADEYVSAYHDPTQCFYASTGFLAQEAIPNYFAEDVRSLGYGALMVWRNPLVEETG
jgi:hypothetical protein